MSGMQHVKCAEGNANFLAVSLEFFNVIKNH
jgi:hypothetical protein